MFTGSSPRDGQAGAIAYLVASAVPNLERSRVRVIDQKGSLLSDGDDERLGLSRREFDYRRDGWFDVAKHRSKDKAVPEPTATLLIAATLALGAGLRRRARSD